MATDILLSNEQRTIVKELFHALGERDRVVAQLECADDEIAIRVYRLRMSLSRKRVMDILSKSGGRIDTLTQRGENIVALRHENESHK